MKPLLNYLLSSAATVALALPALGQDAANTPQPSADTPTNIDAPAPDSERPRGDRPPPDSEGRGGFPGFGGPGGPGGPGGFGGMQQDIKLLEKFDADRNGRLDVSERKAAREFLAKERAEGRLGRGFGGRGGGPRGGDQRPPGAPDAPPRQDGSPDGPRPDRGPEGPQQDGARPDGPRPERGGERPEVPGGRGFGGSGGPGGPGGFGRRENLPPPEPGVKLSPADVKSPRAKPLYDLQTLRTLFLEFENEDWEKELSDFKNTDVEVPAKLIADGKTYKDVGVHFRGASSFMMVGEGRKKSLNLSLDFVHEKQDLAGYRTLNLLNSSGDPSMQRAVLFNYIAREYIPAPRANWVRVVINGENWGLYVNVQQFNKEFTQEWFGSKKGARWKAPGRPNGSSGLEYLGDDVAEYKRRYEIKTKDDPESWASLIELCRVLNQTAPEELEEKLSPLLDIDGALKFLALENVFINTDGYWTRASDYSLYRDVEGRFHIVPHDVNETFRSAEGPGMRGGGGGERGGNPFGLDPFAGANDPRKPLLSKLLAVPALRAKYVEIVRELAETWLDWSKIGPMVQRHQAMLAEEVKLDTRKLSSFEDFERSIEPAQEQGERGGRRGAPLKTFVEQRRAFLLEHPETKGADDAPAAVEVVEAAGQ